MDKLSPNDSVFNTVIDQYKSAVKDSDSSLIKKNLTEEFKTKGDYEGREIYELLQNAEDQGSDYVRITVDNKYISIENGGEKCVPFSRKGFISIMMADMSPKFEDGTKQYIGCKGLGFRSILNWSRSIEICSNGVRCEFSRTIADEWWQDIKNAIRKNIPDNDLANIVIAEHEEFAKRYQFKTPVPTLAKPRVRDYDGPQNSTTIRIEYTQNPDVIRSIKEQLESLSGAILLFLNNIKKIEIDDPVFGFSKTVVATSFNIDNRIRKYDISTSAQGRNATSKSYYVLSHSDTLDDYRYEVSVAYCPESKESGNYVYSFFPTKMRLSLPCIVHATFDLNSSRNALKQNSWENAKLMEVLADVIMEFSSWIAQKKELLGLFDWDASSLLLLNGNDRNDYPILSARIEDQFSHLRVIPTVGNQYKSWDETEFYGSRFSDLFEKMCRSFSNVSRFFGNHVKPSIPKAIEERYEESHCNDSFVSRVNDLSEEMLHWGNQENDYRICLISNLLAKNYGRKFSLLVASDVHQLCEKPCLFVGRTLPDPPTELKNTYIESRLLDSIYKLVGSTDADTVIKRISPVTEVNRSDISHLKKEIIRFTETNSDIDEFKKLIRSFYIGSAQENDNENIADVVKEISTQLKLFDASGTQRHSPYEMVVRDDSDNSFLDYPDEWVLYMSINQWADYLETDIEKARKFFVETLGISTLVPRDYIPFGDDDTAYLRGYSVQYDKSAPAYCFGSRRLMEFHPRNHANYAYVVKPAFLDYLSSKRATCNDVLRVVFSDPACRDSIRNKVIYYQYRSLHEEPVSCSYLEYKLRSHKSLGPVHYYVVSDNLCLQSDGGYSFETLQPYYSEQETKQILLNLGAKASFTDLSKEELYAMLKNVPVLCEPRGVSAIYKKIREALLQYRDKCLIEAKDFCETGTVYARYQGSVKKFAANEVYYWDNDQLPQKVLSTRPKLEIGNRVGEESVRDLFGISLAKDIQIEEVTDESCLNNTLTTHVNSYYKRRIKYLLSYCYKGQNSFKKDYVEPLKDVQFRIFSSYKYKLDDSIEELKEGEMLTSPNQNRVFNICSTVGDITNDCLEDPDLCEAIVESICISIKITGSELVGVFRNIISNTISKNEYLWKKDIEPDTWALIEKIMGISEKEKQFWITVSDKTRRQIDFSLLSMGFRSKVDYLDSVFPEVGFKSLFVKSFPEFGDLEIEKKYSLVLGLSKCGFHDVSMIDEDALLQYYAKRLYEIKNTYGEAFESFKYKNLLATQQKSSDDVYAFYYECQHFLEDHSWTDKLARRNHSSPRIWYHNVRGWLD